MKISSYIGMFGPEGIIILVVFGFALLIYATRAELQRLASIGKLSNSGTIEISLFRWSVVKQALWWSIGTAAILTLVAAGFGIVPLLGSLPKPYMTKGHPNPPSKEWITAYYAQALKTYEFSHPRPVSVAVPSSRPVSISQSNSGGVSVQQATIGNNSPIIDSPVTIGDIPKSITPRDLGELTSFFMNAKHKAVVDVVADQISGTAPFPDSFYDALKAGGWTMAKGGVDHIIGFAAPGKRFQGAVVTIKGDPLKPVETVYFSEEDAVTYIGRALDAFKVPRMLRRNKDQADGLISVGFEGGFPRQ